MSEENRDTKLREHLANERTFKKVETQIYRQTYKSASAISVLLTLSILVGGIFLVIHLLTGIII